MVRFTGSEDMALCILADIATSPFRQVLPTSRPPSCGPSARQVVRTSHTCVIGRLVSGLLSQTALSGQMFSGTVGFVWALWWLLPNY